MEIIMKENGRIINKKEMELNLIRMEIYCIEATGFKVNFRNDFNF